MNDQSTINTENALVLPDATELPALFKGDQIDLIIERIEKEALAIAPDPSTTKGRKAIASLAHKVARSKTTLDNAGKDLTEAARAEIDAVNAQRKTVRDRLDALKAKVRKPLDDWEEAEAKRRAAHQERMALFQKDRTDWQMPVSEIEAVIAEVEAIETGETWEEFSELATEAKSEALEKYRADHKAAKGREEQERELARLRAEREELERKAKEEEERKAQEQAEKAAQKSRADGLMQAIKDAGNGMIGGQMQPYGILIYELENKIADAITDALGEHRAAVEELRVSTLTNVKAAMEKQSEERARREQEEREQAEQRAREEERRKAEEKAEAERLEAERQAEAKRKEQERREKNARHRNKVLREISQDIDGIDIADLPAAMLNGKIRHVRVEL